MTRIQRKKRVQKLLDRLIAKEDHHLFLTKKHPSLDNQCAIDLIETDEGYQRVIQLLHGMEDGAFI